VRTRSVILAAVLAGSRVHAQPIVHASAVAALAPEHLRTLETALTRELGNIPTTLDVSLTKLDVTPIGGDLEVKVELRALVSDEKGRVVWSSTANATARGSARERTQLHRDAITAAAQALGKRVRSRPPRH
jgi:hypothetical protein